jgi:histone-lysine N-methyltransferase SETMAR
MDQQSICLFLAMKRLSAQATYNLATDHEQIWLQPGETPPERARHAIQDRKIMVAIAWNPLGFPLIVALPKGRTFNAEYYRNNILAALTQLQPEDDGRKLVAHADNARVHTAQKYRTFCEENGLRLVPHPPYSPDLAPSGFFLFGYVKEHLKGMVFSSYEELFDAIGEVVTGIKSETLTAVFGHWMERLKWMSKNNGDYYP